MQSWQAQGPQPPQPQQQYGQDPPTPPQGPPQPPPPPQAHPPPPPPPQAPPHGPFSGGPYSQANPWNCRSLHLARRHTQLCRPQLGPVLWSWSALALPSCVLPRVSAMLCWGPILATSSRYFCALAEPQRGCCPTSAHLRKLVLTLQAVPLQCPAPLCQD